MTAHWTRFAHSSIEILLLYIEIIVLNLETSFFLFTNVRGINWERIETILALIREIKITWNSVQLFVYWNRCLKGLFQYFLHEREHHARELKARQNAPIRE